MRRSFRSLLVGLIAVAQPLEATAQVYDFSPTNRYFRYRVDGIDVTGVNVVVRGPTEVVVTGTLASAETRVRGGDAPFVYSVDSGALPDGMTLDPATGAANGTAARAGRYVFTVRATDRTGQTGVSLPYAIVVQNQKLEITRSPSLSARSGTAYSDRLEASGGRQPYAWTVAQGILPSGIGLNETTGALTGTAALNGQYLFRVQVKDADGAVVVSPEYVLFVDDSVLSIAGSSPTKGQVGSAFTARYTASGGHSPYSYALSGSPLPPGVALEADTGWIRGSPAAAGEYVGLRVRATDNSQRYVDSPYFSVSVVAPLTAAWMGGKAGTGAQYAAAVRPTGGRAPYAFALTAGTLPPGLSLNTSDGIIAGTPTSEGTRDGIVVRVSDVDGRVFDTDPFSIEVTNELVAVGTPVRTATLGSPYSSQVSAGGGLRPYGYRMSAGTLPAGLALDGISGTIQGTPSANGAAEGLRIRVTDASGRSVETQTFSISVRDQITLSTAGLPATVLSGDDYVGRLAATGGQPPYRFSISQTLPQDLFLDPLTGAVSGKAGPINAFRDLVATVFDAEGRQGASAQFGIDVVNPVVVDPPARFATVGQSFTSQAPTRGGRAPYRWSLKTSLPGGLSLDPATGTIAGTPSQVGTTTNVVIEVADRDGRTASTAPFDFTVDPTTAVVSAPTRSLMVYMKDSSLPAPEIKDGTAPFTYALNKDAPSWITIDPSTGVVSGSGQGSVGAVYGLQIETTDARGRVGKSPIFAMRLVAPMTISYASSSMPFDTDSRATYAASVANGCGSPTWSLSSNRPSRIDVDSIGRISTVGLTRFDVGNWPGVVVTAVDTCGFSATTELVMDVQGGTAAIQAPGQILVKAGSSFGTDPVSVSNMSGPTFSLGGRSPESFMAFDARTGVISGKVPADTPSGTTWTYGLQALDAYGRRAFASNNTIIKAVTPPQISYGNGGKLPFQTDAYGSYASTVVGGCPVSGYQVTAGSLPGGLYLRPATGTIELSGAPLYSGRTGPVTISMRDTCDQVATTDVTIDIRTGSPTATGPTQKSLIIGAASSTDAVASVGFPPDAVYTVTGAALPAGIVLDANRKFSGTLDQSVPNATVLGPYVVRISDDFGRAAQTETIRLTAVNASQISYAGQTPATTGQAFALNPTVSGGAAPFAYQLAGTLPAGLSFNSGTGRIDGTPTGTGTSANLTVRITDATGYVATSNAFSIQTAAPVTVAGTPPDAQTGTAYSYAFTAAGGQGALTFSTGSSLPPGLTLSGAGVLSGTPTQNGAFSLAIVATDAAGRTGSRFPTLNIGKAVSGGAWASWGTGQLGNGETSSLSYVPREATILPTLTSVAIVGEGNAACGIRTDGQIVCWGSNFGGRLGNGSAITADAGSTASNTPVAVAVAGPWSQVVGGRDYFCGLKEGGIYCWGSSASAIGRTSDAPSPTLVGSGYTAVAASPGGNSTCGIKTDGSAFCWGMNASSTGTFTTTPTLVPAAGTSRWSRIAPGASSVCGVQSDASLWCWGNNNTAQLGRGGTDSTYSATPARIGAKNDWVEVVNDGASNCAINASGVGYCWGSAANGQLGTGAGSGTYAPTAIAGGLNWAKLSASGDGAMCGLSTSGGLYCWGRNDRGQLASGSTTTAYYPASAGNTSITYTDVAMGPMAYALPREGTPSASTSGRLYAWGAPAGLGTTAIGDGSSPIVVGTVGNWIGTTGGSLFGCGWTADGNGSCWGQNAAGQLGNGTTTNSRDPTTIAGGRSWLHLAAADSTTCGIAKGNKLFCWGNNAKGQMGSSGGSNPSPTAAGGTEYFQRVFAGPNNFCATTYGGQLKCWGPNTTGIVGNGTSGNTPVTQPTAIGANITVTTAAVGNTAACGIRDNGNLYCWGNSDYGQIMGNGSSTNPLPVSSNQWTAIAAAGESFCAIRADARLFCWGNNPASGALLGDRSSGTPKAVGALRTETEVYGGGSWLSIVGAQGQTAFCGTRTNGSTSCWGQTGSIPNATANPSPMVSPSVGGMLGIGLGYMNGYGIR